MSILAFHKYYIKDKQFCVPFLVCPVEAPLVTANAHIKVAMRADGESGFILSVDIVEFN